MRAGTEGERFRNDIRKSGLTIYDAIPRGEKRLWLPSQVLEALLSDGLEGLSLKGMPLRTRSKVVKGAVCRALGYPVPPSFKRTKPRFPGQDFDTYVQKANNLQIWNEELAAERRYVVIGVSQDDVINRVRVVDGHVLARLDRTGTLTQKYQARYERRSATRERRLADTALLSGLLGGRGNVRSAGATDNPRAGEILPIRDLFERLARLVGLSFEDTGAQSDRARGSALHEIVSRELGFAEYHDDGRFPDLRNQLVELKLQTSPTIDLGLVRPDSTEPLDMAEIGGRRIRHCDVRYAVFGAKLHQGRVKLLAVDVVTGQDFFEEFPQFQGKVVNRKLQIPLPDDFFGA